MSQPTYHELREHNDSLQRGHARLLSEVARLEGEREAYRQAAAYLLAEGGWRSTYYENSGPCPDVIDTSDTFNPRLKTPEELRAALSPSLLRPQEDEGVPLADAIGGPSANRAPVPDAATPTTEKKGNP